MKNIKRSSFSLVSALSRRADRLSKGKEKQDKTYKEVLSPILEKLNELQIDILSVIKPSETNIEVDSGTTELLDSLKNGLGSFSENIRNLPNVFKELYNGLKLSLKSDIEKIEIPPPKVEFPKIQQISGQVEIKNQIVLKELISKIDVLNRDISRAIAGIRFPEQKEIKFPEIRIPDYPKTTSIAEGRLILNALEKLSKEINSLPEKIKFPEVNIPSTVKIGNFPPQKYPLPVTNININPLRGFVKTRNIIVTTSLTPLPDEVLSNRRALVVFNNSSQTVYVGGSDVTISNGMPVPKNSYSPAFDAGPRMIVYGIVASSTADVRVMELSNEAVGG